MNLRKLLRQKKVDYDEITVEIKTEDIGADLEGDADFDSAVAASIYLEKISD